VRYLQHYKRTKWLVEMRGSVVKGVESAPILLILNSNYYLSSSTSSTSS